MLIYVLVQALVGVAAAILPVILTKKAANTVRCKLDRVGAVTNFILLPIYVVAAPFCMTIGVLCTPHYDGVLGIIGWIVSVILASAVLVCGLGLGASVALRRKGKSKLSFAVQFVGLLSIVLTFGLFFSLYGNLLAPLN